MTLAIAPIPEVAPIASRCEEFLSRSLREDVDVYYWHDGRWQLQVDRGVTRDSDELQFQLHEIHDSTELTIFETNQSSYAILPVHQSAHRFIAVVRSDRKEEGDSRWSQLVRLAHENLHLRLLGEKPPMEIRGAEDFLPAVLQQIANLSPGYQFSDVANVLLPTLASSIDAQSVAIVPEGKSTRSAFIAHGEPVGDLAEWERIVETCCESQGDSEVYRRVCGVGYSAIHNFVIAPIRMAESLFGWIVADVDESDEGDVSRAQTTALMNTSAVLLATHAFADERLQHKEKLLLDVVRSLVSAIDAKDPQTCGHSVRVAIFASLVAEGLGLSPRECDELYLAGLLHDVGKIGIPESIFQKETSLTEEEFELVKQHPDHGWKILHRLEELQHILPGVVHHHESLDGTGYPDQIAGDDIPLAARILAVVDAYDALTSDRNYRKGKTHLEAMRVLTEGAGVQWDPVVVEALHSKARRIQRVSKKYRREAHPWRIPGSIEPQDIESNGTDGSTLTSRYDAFGVDRI